MPDKQQLVCMLDQRHAELVLHPLFTGYVMFVHSPHNELTNLYLHGLMIKSKSSPAVCLTVAASHTEIPINMMEHGTVLVQYLSQT